MEKIWAIPDIHGCLETLKLLIFQQINPDKKDHLIFLGDYIDRGPDSKGVLDFIMNLEENGYHMTTLTGNHESICVKAFDENTKSPRLSVIPGFGRFQQHWLRLGGEQTLQSFKVKSSRDIPQKYIDWMRSRDYYIELEHFFAVHAGFNFNQDDPFSDKESMIWVRNFDIKPEKTGNKKIVHGHTPTPLNFIEQNIEYNIFDSIDLDNGVYLKGLPGYGNLVALELKSMEYKVQPVVDEVHYS